MRESLYVLAKRLKWFVGVEVGSLQCPQMKCSEARDMGEVSLTRALSEELCSFTYCRLGMSPLIRELNFPRLLLNVPRIHEVLNPLHFYYELQKLW